MANKIKFSMVFALLTFMVSASFSQTRQPIRRNNYGDNSQQPPNNPKDTIPKQQNSDYGNNNNVLYQRDTSLPITVIKGSGNGLLDSVKISLRNDASIEQNLVKDRQPLPYENLREDDAVFRVRVWREIDTREKMNLPFQYSAEEDNGNQRFISILLQAIKDGDVTAFSGDDDRFTTPITFDDAMKAFAGGSDTVPKIDRDGNVVGYEVRAKQFDPDSIYKFRLKEEWIFDKESSRLFVRILGIAPVIPYRLSTGDIIPNSERPVWWVYYPDMRPVLAKHDVYNPKNYGSRMTWEELFESRMFSSYITKSTMDNPFDQSLANIYPNNTLFRLLKGEQIKEKIFNYEQSLWSY
ncbi:MAG: gliding motility protein GldN [Bacteroidetes bacterium]|nr:gliding motility protein GldN [Bacteroidota bacterium]